MANNDTITQFPVPVVATPGLKNIWSINPGPTTVLYVNAALEWTKNGQISSVVDNTLEQFYPASIPDSEDDDDEDQDKDDNSDSDDYPDGEDKRMHGSQSTIFSFPSQSQHLSTDQPSTTLSQSSVNKGKGKAPIHDAASLAPAGSSSSYPPVFQHFAPQDVPADAYMEPVSPEALPSSSFNPFLQEEFAYDVEMLSPSVMSDAMDYGQDPPSLAVSASNDNLPYTQILNSRINFDHFGSESTSSLLTMASGLSHHSVLDPSFDINSFLQLLLASPDKAQDYLKSAGTLKSGKTTTIIGDMVASTRVVTTAYNAAHLDGWNRPTSPNSILDTAQFTVTFFSTVMKLVTEKKCSKGLDFDLNCKSMYYII